LWPFELLGTEVAIAVVSALFGVLGLLIFKYISWQKGIKSTKDQIKGHMIEIRIYQDDLAVVGKAVGKVMLRNFQYLSLNILPFVPLSVPFVILVSQLVVRYAFEPLEEHKPFTITVELAQEHRKQVADLEVIAPDWAKDELVIVRAPSDGRAFVSVRDAVPGAWEFGFRVGSSGTVVEKSVIIGADTEVPRAMQPERVGTFFAAWLWPAESTIHDSPIERIAIENGYPESSFAFLPDGILGLLLGVILYSFIAGIAVLKPLGVTI
jgi:hypothetical protein